MYKVVYARAARAVLKTRPRKRAERIFAIIDRIAANPLARHPNLDTIKGEKNTFRYRLGDWRILYEVDRESRTLKVLDILPRGRAYE